MTVSFIPPSISDRAIFAQSHRSPLMHLPPHIARQRHRLPLEAVVREVKKSATPFHYPTLEFAVLAVKNHKTPFAFVAMCTEEEKRFMESLSAAEIAKSFQDMPICVLQTTTQTDATKEDPLKAERLQEITSRIFNQLQAQKFTKVPVFTQKPELRLKERWHVDLRHPQGAPAMWTSQKGQLLRVTWAIHGDTTDFFDPTDEEALLLNQITLNRLIARRAGQWDKKEDLAKQFSAHICHILETAPTRQLSGHRYDACVFLDITPHAAPINQDLARGLLSIDSTERSV